MKLTLDTNCLVDLELSEGAVLELQKLVTAHDTGRIEIGVPGIGASERLKDGTFAENFSVFRQRIQRLSRREFEILKPPIYLGLTYFDWAIFGDNNMVNLEREIHDVLFSKIEFRWKDFAQANGLDPNEAAEGKHKEWIKWRNRKCDTLALWCHIYYGRDVFVTQDKNFHKATKKIPLMKLGATSILYPSEVNI